MADNNIFNQKDKGGQEFKEQVDTHSKAILTVTQRQKDLESSLDILSEKIDLLDHNSIRNFKKMAQDIKDIRLSAQELKGEVNSIKEFNSRVIKQLKLMTTKDEVQKLEKYIDLWDPMNFVTREELEEHRNKMKKDFEEIIKKYMSN